MNRCFLLIFTGLALLIAPACRKTTTPPPPETGNFRIGVYASLSGPTSAQTQAISNAAQLAGEEINRAGGVNGRQIEIVIEDDKGSPDQAVAKLINQSRMHAVVGAVASPAAEASARSAKIPLLTLSGKGGASQAGDFSFAVASPYSTQGTDMGKYAASNLNARRAAILFDEASNDSSMLAKAFEESFAKPGGQVVAKQACPAGSQTFKEQLKTASAATPEVIYIPLPFQAAGVIAREAKELGIKAVLLGTDGWNNTKLFELGGKALDGAYISGPYSADDPTQANRDFANAYKRRFGSAPDQTAALAYDAIKLLADAFKRAGTTDGARLRDAISQTAKFNGLTGPITIDSKGDTSRPMTVFKLQDGKIYPVYRSEN